jgi:phosphate transport system substrate-binding protein
MRLKKALATMLVGVMAIAFVGCGSKDASDSNADSNSNTGATTENSGNLNGTVVITGSTSVEKIITDMIDEFQALNPDVTVNYTGTGSSAGITDSAAGSNTLGVSSRDLKEEEKADNIHTETFAYDGIAVVVNPASGVTDITLETLAKIYSGQITNWSELGGKDAEIVVVSREGSSGTRDAFEELVGLEDAGGLTENANVVEGNGNAQSTVAGNENAIGYVSFSYVDETVKELTVEGVEPTAENAKAGTYKISRPFIFVYNDSTVTPEAKAFIEYAKSADGQAFVEEHGGIKID